MDCSFSQVISEDPKTSTKSSDYINEENWQKAIEKLRTMQFPEQFEDLYASLNEYSKIFWGAHYKFAPILMQKSPGKCVEMLKQPQVISSRNAQLFVIVETWESWIKCCVSDNLAARYAICKTVCSWDAGAKSDKTHPRPHNSQLHALYTSGAYEKRLQPVRRWPKPVFWTTERV